MNLTKKISYFDHSMLTESQIRVTAHSCKHFPKEKFIKFKIKQ